MGFLKRLPSFSKRNRNKIAERSPTATSLDPLKENVKPDLSLDVIPLNAVANINPKATNPNTSPSTAGPGIFDDIFTDFNQISSSSDSLQADISLSFALSQQLQLESTANQQKEDRAQESSLSTTATATTSSSLFGQDSIYSSYVNKPQQNRGSDTSSPSPPSLSNTGVASCINTSSSITQDTEKYNEQGETTPMILDSDISGSDDDNDDTSGSEEEAWGTQQQHPTEGVCSVAEKRPNDHRPNTKRSNTMMESNQTMLDRMKNRHRQQVKMQQTRTSPTPTTMRPSSPVTYTTAAHPSSFSVSSTAVPIHFQRNMPAASPLTRSSSASSAYRHHASPWVQDYTPSRPSPLAPKRSLRSQPSPNVTSTATSATSLHIASTLSQEDDQEDADDEADHEADDAALQRHYRPNPTYRNKGISSIHHSCSVPDFKNKKRQDSYSPPSSSSLISDQHSTTSLSSSSSVSTSTTTTSPPSQRHLFSGTPSQQQEGYSLHRMRSMTSEPDLKQLAFSVPHHHHHQASPINGYHQFFIYQQQQQLQQQRQRMQLEWEMMQLYQREQQLKQEYMLLQQRSYLSTPIHKSSTLPSLSTAHQDPRFYYPSSLGPGSH